MGLQAVAKDEWVDHRGAADGASEGRLGHTALVDDGVGEFGHSDVSVKSVRTNERGEAKER